MNQLLAIRVFARVLEAGSFTKAADSLEMPKTSVSKLKQHEAGQLLHQPQQQQQPQPQQKPQRQPHPSQQQGAQQ